VSQKKTCTLLPLIKEEVCVFARVRLSICTADVWANYMSCHPRATCHIADCNNSIRDTKNRFSPYYIYIYFFLGGGVNAVWALTSGGFRTVSDTLVLLVVCFHMLYVIDVLAVGPIAHLMLQ